MTLDNDVKVKEKKTEGIEKTILLAIIKTHKFQGKIFLFLETMSV